MKKTFTPKNIGIMALFVSIGIILQYVESRILISPVPGGKLGLSNIVTIINIFIFGGGNAVIISILRAFLGTFLTGGVTALPYSIVGAFFATLTMCFVKKYLYPKVSMVGMSILGACAHNIAQLAVASIVFGSVYLFSYLPMLFVVALVSGTVTGVGAQIFGKRILSIGEKI